MSVNPYKNYQKDKKGITKELWKSHPFSKIGLITLIETAWQAIWNTSVGGFVQFGNLGLGGSQIAGMFEKVFLEYLKNKDASWRGPKNVKTDKDFVYVKDNKLSVELKMSGQKGTKIFGNRSYSKSSSGSKVKDGYYLAINFDVNEKKIKLVRFGWINHSDWKGQKSETGQSASLGKEIYDSQLLIIKGNYQKLAPVEILKGVSNKTVLKWKKKGINISTIQDIIQNENSIEKKIVEKAKDFLKCDFYN